MSENKQIQGNPILGTIVVVLLLFFAINKGTRWYADYSMMKDSMDKIAFMEKNQADSYKLCSAISNAIDVANVTKSQKELDQLKEKQKLLYCE